MRYRKLGESRLEASVMSLGTWQFADTGYWGSQGNAAETVRAALDHGINFFDCAEGYAGGESEKVLGLALGQERRKALIATKVSAGHCGAAKLKSSCEQSLKRLRTDYIDLYQVHWPARNIPFAETYAELAGLKEEGKIREVGISNFGVKDMEQWLACGDLAVSNQLGYNLLFRAIEYQAVPACISAGMGILAYMPLMQGILAGRWQRVGDIPPRRRRSRHFSGNREGTRHGGKGHEELTMKTLSELSEAAREAGLSMADTAIAWLTAQPGISSVIVGGRKPEQITANVRAVEVELEDAFLEKLNAITEPLKKALGDNLDMWENEAGSRSR